MAHGASHYRQEALYSLLSWLRVRQAAGQEAAPCDALVVTDAPQDFIAVLGDAPEVRYLMVSQEQLQLWQGGAQGYVHRIKPLAMLHAARELGARRSDVFMFIDSDTSFLADPSSLLALVAGGTVVLHEREGTIVGNRSHTKSQRRLYDAACKGLIPDGALGAHIDATMPLWNSGVIGLRGDQLDVLDETVDLIDRMTSTLRLTTAEQVALAAVLQRRSVSLEPASHFVFHYYLFKEFRTDLAAFFSQHAGASLSQWLGVLDQIDPVRRSVPKLHFTRQPKWWRQILKAFGHNWRPLPYPWHSASSNSEHHTS
jgi:hypothetical protein